MNVIQLPNMTERIQRVKFSLMQVCAYFRSTDTAAKELTACAKLNSLVNETINRLNELNS